MKLRVYNSTLDPNIWNEDKSLKPHVRESLIKVAEDFYNSTELKGSIQNILFLGSSANYNWTPTSDIDLHIIIDISEEKINEEYARKFMDGLSFKWNTDHSVEVKGHPVEVYLQDIREPNSTPQLARPGAAIYSLVDDKWLLEPNHQNVTIDKDKVRRKFLKLKKRIDGLVDTCDFDKLKSLMKQISNYRNAGLSKGGELSSENLVFKALRHSGDLKTLKDTINRIYDKQASLPEGGNIQPHKKTNVLKEEIVDVDKYIVVGIIDKKLHVISEKDYRGQENVTHEKLLQKNHQFTYRLEDLVFWRYKSINNTLYWYDHTTEAQKFVVLGYLNKKYHIVTPKQTISQHSYANDAHNVNEILSTDEVPKLIKQTAYEYIYEFEVDEQKYVINFKRIDDPDSYQGAISEYLKPHMDELDMDEKREFVDWLYENQIWVTMLHEYENEIPKDSPARAYIDYSHMKSIVTGKMGHKAVTVYSKFIAALKDFGSKKQPRILSFIPEEDRQGKLYGKLVDKVIKEFGYKKIDKEPYFGESIPERYFVFEKNK